MSLTTAKGPSQPVSPQLLIQSLPSLPATCNRGKGDLRAGTKSTEGNETPAGTAGAKTATGTGNKTSIGSTEAIETPAGTAGAKTAI